MASLAGMSTDGALSESPHAADLGRHQRNATATARAAATCAHALCSCILQASVTCLPHVGPQAASACEPVVSGPLGCSQPRLLASQIGNASAAATEAAGARAVDQRPSTRYPSPHWLSRLLTHWSVGRPLLSSECQRGQQGAISDRGATSLRTPSLHQLEQHCWTSYCGISCGKGKMHHLL